MIERKIKNNIHDFCYEKLHTSLTLEGKLKIIFFCVCSTFKICVDAKEIKFSAIWIQVLRNCSCLVRTMKIVFDRRCTQKEPQRIHDDLLHCMLSQFLRYIVSEFFSIN